jgi:hypothetical protein
VSSDGNFMAVKGSDSLHNELSTDPSGRADISLLWTMHFGLVQVIVASDGFFLREWETPAHPDSSY